MKSPRKKLLTVTVSQDIIERVDDYLERQYNAWKNNFIHDEEQQQLKQTSNQLLFDYIRYIYKEYSLKDPLQSTESPSSCFEPQASSVIKIHKHNMSDFQVKKVSNFQTQTPKQFKQSRDRSSILTHTEKKQKRYISSLSLSGKTVIKPGQAQSAPHNQMKKISLLQPLNPKIQQKSYINQPVYHHPKNIQRIPVNITYSNDDDIQKKYKYCLGCQEIILSANVLSHQRKCPSFKKLYSMSLEQILSYIQDKVNEISKCVGKCGDQLQEQDASEIHKNCAIMEQQSNNIAQNGVITDKFQNSYGKTMIIGQKWLNSLQTINKLRWFIFVRELIKKKFDK